MMILGKGASYDAEGERDVNPRAIERELGASLERLGIETIDLYLLHRDDHDCPVGPRRWARGGAESGRAAEARRGTGR